MIDTGELPALPTRIPTAPPAWRETADVVIIGTGAAGLSAAIGLLEAGHRVAMITKGTAGDGSTAWAQGGLAAVLDDHDRLDDHVRDTLVAGAGLCEPSVVAELVAAAPEAIDWLDRLGAAFDCADGGGYALGLEGGHHARRIVHAGGDASGAAVSSALTDRTLSLSKGRALTRGLTLHEHTAATDLSKDDHGLTGVRVIDADGDVGEILAPAVILAAGGIGQAWETTSNPATATGDGLALALRAGAVLRDVEFVQFHPTVLVVPEAHRRDGDRGVLISEAVRGEGAVIVDRRGKLIMKDQHPLADLAPRDVVASTMHAELLASGDDHLFLDGTGLGEETWREHFPTILQLCRARGVDPVNEPIPVRPAEHYWCGGVLATLDGETTVAGLYAVGEVASTGVQGANRLASNSLTEAVVAGRRVARTVSCESAEWGRSAESGRSAEGRGPWSPALEASSGCASLPDEFQTPGPPRDHGPRPSARQVGAWRVMATDRPEVVAAISAGVGVLRDEAGLAVALKTLGDLEPSAEAAGVAEVEATNLFTVGVVVGAAALTRTESRGCHRRSDHPVAQESWRRHSLVRLGPSGLEITHSEELDDDTI